MAKVIVNVDNRKMRSDAKALSGSVFEQVKRQRKEQNQKRLAELHREINKIVRSN